MYLRSVACLFKKKIDLPDFPFALNQLLSVKPVNPIYIHIRVYARTYVRDKDCPSLSALMVDVCNDLDHANVQPPPSWPTYLLVAA